MPLKIIRSGLTGKNSDIYINEIKQLYNEKTDRKLILMVPDKFSYIAEKLVCEEIGGMGMGGVSVMTLHQLIRRISNTDKVLSAQGKQMLLRRIVNSCISEESVFFSAMDKQGFVESIVEVMDDWKHFCVDADCLDKDISSIPEGITKYKLSTLKDIYCRYLNEFEENHYFDEADLLTAAAEAIKSSSEFAGCVLWIDGFVELVPAEIGVINAFLSVGAEVKIYLPCKKDGVVEPSDTYYVPEQTCINLKHMCIENGYRCEIEEISSHKKMKDEIAFLCDTYDNRERVYNGLCESVVINQAKDIYSEVEYAASEILNLVCNKGYNFSDISVLCGELSSYNSCIEAVFSRYSIPYFSDYKTTLSNHPVSILLMSVFEIVNNKSFSLRHIVRYLKTGYIVSCEDDIDFLSLFAEKRGIRGSMWTDKKYFEKAASGFFDEAMGIEARPVHDSEKLDSLRREIIEPLMSYYHKSKGKKTVKEHITAFFDYLKEINLFSKIEEKITEFERLGEKNEASRLAHVWNILINLFDQMVIAVGDEVISRSVFGEYLKAGIEGSEISIIPNVTNGVSVSDAGHRKGSQVKALIILGATRETVPPLKHEDGLVTEDELSSIKSLPSSVGKSYRNQSKEFELLSAFSETSDLLYMSWSKFGADNEKEEASPVFDLLLNKFPGLKFSQTDDKTLISSPKSMLHKLLVHIAAGDEMSSDYEAVLEWFSGKQEWSDAVALIEEANRYKQLVGSIPKNISAKLYNDLTAYSVSRLEKYFMCPFMYFVSYGLKLDDGEAYGMKSTDTGSLVHHALAQFCQTVEDNACTPEEKKTRWEALTDSKRDEIINGIMNAVKEKAGISDDPKMESIFARLTSTVRKAADMIVLMLNNGKYTIYGNELRFENFTLSTDDGDACFHGIIDRLDVYEEDGKVNIRIVDYKTGDKSFNFADALNGIDLQLLIYAMAAENMLGHNSEISGFFYNSLKKKIVSCDDQESLSKELAKLYKLSGIVVEKTSEGVYHIKTGADMDKDLCTNGESSFLPLKLKKDGKYFSKSAVESPEFMDEVYRNIRAVAANGAGEIENGDVRVYPYVTSKKDSCRFCPYSSLCMYDREAGAEVNDGASGKQLLAEIKDNNRIG